MPKSCLWAPFRSPRFANCQICPARDGLGPTQKVPSLPPGAQRSASWSSLKASRMLLGLLVEMFVPEGDPRAALIRYSPYLAIADLVDPFVEDDLVMPLAAVHDVLTAREPFVVERVDLVVSISPYQRVVAVVAIQGVVPLPAIEAVLSVGTVRVVPVIVASHHVVSGTAVDGVVAEVTVKFVAALAPSERVVALLAVQVICAAQALHRVIAAETDHLVFGGGAIHGVFLWATTARIVGRTVDGGCQGHRAGHEEHHGGYRCHKQCCPTSHLYFSFRLCGFSRNRDPIHAILKVGHSPNVLFLPNFRAHAFHALR